jgi:hypothetical protein
MGSLLMTVSFEKTAEFVIFVITIDVNVFVAVVIHILVQLFALITIRKYV